METHWLLGRLGEGVHAEEHENTVDEHINREVEEHNSVEENRQQNRSPHSAVRDSIGKIKHKRFSDRLNRATGLLPSLASILFFQVFDQLTLSIQKNINDVFRIVRSLLFYRISNTAKA